MRSSRGEPPVRPFAALLLLAACASPPAEDAPLYGQPIAPSGLEGFTGITAVGARVLIAGQPTPLGLANARDDGVKVVINLRPASEMSFDERIVAQGLGMEYGAIPFTNDSLSDVDVGRFPGKMREGLKREGEDDRVLVRCRTGDRAAALWALYEITEGKAHPEAAVARARQAGLRSPELVQYIGEYARRIGVW